MDADPADEGQDRDRDLADVVRGPGQGGGLDQGAGRGQDVALDQGVDPDPGVAQAPDRDAG